ncbi:MAG: nucleoside triphosphate pyrophosphohydrolase [Longimicrobiales bacterium]
MDADPPNNGGILENAMELVSFLRKNCEWDKVQTHESLIKHLVEECHEVASAIVSAGAPWPPGDTPETGSETLSGELGDLLLNLAFQLVISEEEERFDRTHVWQKLEDKMQRRHPHLFGLGEEVSWERAKSAEGVRESALEGVAPSLPPLAKAYLVQRRASSVGFDWGEPAGALDKVIEETTEVAELLDTETDTSGLEEELGDLIFSVVNLARLADVDPAVALERANQKFSRRFRRVEALARERDLPMPGSSLEQLDRLWDEAKLGETG